MIERTIFNELELVSFGNETKAERKLLKQFVNFHWDLYKMNLNMFHFWTMNILVLSLSE